MQKYTYDILVAAVQLSTSVSDVVRSLGVQPTGSINRHIRSRLTKFGIDTEHFVRSQRLLPGTRVTAAERLISRTSGNRTQGKLLRRALNEIGRSETCEKCGCGNTWEGEPLTLQVDHKNSNILDDSPDNLRYLCPNCHSQTNSHSRARTPMPWALPPKFCATCNKKLFKHNLTGFCRKCRPFEQYTSRCPPRDVLLKMVWEKPTTKIAKEFGVSDKAVTKWCRKLGITKPSFGYWTGRNDMPCECDG